jgi:Tfp pilus assembly protein PilF
LYVRALLQQGRTQEGASVVVRGLEAARAEAHLFLARAAAAAQGDDAAAEQAFQQGISIGEQIGDNAMLSSGPEQYGAFLAERGRYQQAYEQMTLSQTAVECFGSHR